MVVLREQVRHTIRQFCAVAAQYGANHVIDVRYEGEATDSPDITAPLVLQGVISASVVKYNPEVSGNLGYFTPLDAQRPYKATFFLSVAREFVPRRAAALPDNCEAERGTLRSFVEACSIVVGRPTSQLLKSYMFVVNCLFSLCLHSILTRVYANSDAELRFETARSRYKKLRHTYLSSSFVCWKLFMRCNRRNPFRSSCQGNQHQPYDPAELKGDTWNRPSCVQKSINDLHER